MTRKHLRTACFVALGVVASASAQETIDTAPILPPGIVGAPGGSGPYPAVAEVPASLVDHVVYYPQGAARGRLPVILWGNGGCRDNGLRYAGFLREIASHGFLVVAAGHARREEPMRAAPAFTTTPTPPGGRTRSGAPAPRAGRDASLPGAGRAGLGDSREQAAGKSSRWPDRSRGRCRDGHELRRAAGDRRVGRSAHTHKHHLEQWGL